MSEKWVIFCYIALGRVRQQICVPDLLNNTI